ncbi:MAG: isoleucine--tRNA ligase, partial [Clostridiales bacterium]|nr:isoleucine--tRNA ligase [Clostridiales bacterium]
NVSAAESVHLADFPVYDESRIDVAMEQQMDDLIQVVQLGRAGRNAAAIKVRQPLSTLYVKGVTFGQNYIDLAKEELNVKEVLFTDDAQDFMTYAMKPQMKTLGPKYGKLLGAIRDYLAQADGNVFVNTFEKGETVSFDLLGSTITLLEEDVLTTPISKSGFMSQSDGDITAVLDTNLTQDLIEEGLAREVISKIQTMRKEAEFDVSDRIELLIETDSNLLATALEKQSKMITDSVLALSLSQKAPTSEFYSKSWNINGEEALLAIRQVSHV